jgi:hypothetical protein
VSIRLATPALNEAEPTCGLDPANVATATSLAVAAVDLPSDKDWLLAPLSDRCRTSAVANRVFSFAGCPSSLALDISTINVGVAE